MRALVTGGNGHLGLQLVRTLRERGDPVRASVRSLADHAKTAPLRALHGVELVAASLDDAAAWPAAMAGVDTLFHTAAVYSTCEPGRDQEILDASLQGGAHVLRAAAAAGVRRVVFTSSVVTLPLTAPGAAPSTETDWADDLRVPYFRAKTEGEQQAWRLANELGLAMVSVLPGGIIGPGFQRNTPTIDIIEAAMFGAFRLGVPDGNFTFVDVRDVAAAHLLAAERRVSGRFIVNAEQPSLRRLIETMHAVDPRVPLPWMQLPRLAAPALPWFDRLNHALLGTPRVASPEAVATALGDLRWNVSSERARAELGWSPQVRFEDSLRDTMAAIRALRAQRGG